MESISEADKENIELIDFPGIDFDVAKKKAEDLLKIMMDLYILIIKHHLVQIIKEY